MEDQVPATLVWVFQPIKWMTLSKCLRGSVTCYGQNLLEWGKEILPLHFGGFSWKEKKRTLASKCVLRLCPISIYLLVPVTFVVSSNPQWESLVFPWGAVPTLSEHVWGWRGSGFGYLLFGCFSASWGIAVSIHQVRSKRLHPCGWIVPLWTVSRFMELVKNYSRGRGCQEGTPDIHTLPRAPVDEAPIAFACMLPSLGDVGLDWLECRESFIEQRKVLDLAEQN